METKLRPGENPVCAFCDAQITPFDTKATDREYDYHQECLDFLEEEDKAHRQYLAEHPPEPDHWFFTPIQRWSRHIRRKSRRIMLAIRS